MLRKPLVITIEGKDFIDGEAYKCLFHPTNSTAEYLETGFFSNIVTPIFVSSTEMTCHVPLSV